MRPTTAARHTLVLLCLAAAAPQAGAQTPEPTSLPTGTRVRLTALGIGSERLVGTLVGADASALSLDTGKRVIAVPRGDVTRIELSQARSRRGRWAGYGALAGAVAGGIAGYASGEDCSAGESLCFSHETFAFGGAVVGAPVGALLGALFGPGERWEPIPVAGVRVGVQPTLGRGRGAGVTVSVGF